LYKGDNPVTPGTKNISIPAHTLLREALTILGDSDLLPKNIREGINLFGIAGTMAEGVTGIDFGTIYLSSDAVPSEIAHSLGCVPSYAVMVAEIPMATSSAGVVIVGSNDSSVSLSTNTSGRATSAWYPIGTSTKQIIATDTTVKFNAKMQSGTCYWFVVA
jgi:hypothetical protein